MGLAPAAAGSGHGFLERTYRAADGKEFKYVLFVPGAYQGDKPYPLILYLHGSGEGGTDGWKPARAGLGPAIRKQEKTFPFLARFPQGRRSDWDANSDDSRRALALRDEVQRTYGVDPRRIYSPLLRVWLRGAGLQAAECDDLCQQVLHVLFRRLLDFGHSGKPGAFRAWLRGGKCSLVPT
jgi:hypothetical protein